MISSLPGKALRMLAESQGLPANSTYNVKAKPGKLDIKRRKPVFYFISFTSCFTVQTSDYDVIIDFCVNSMSSTRSFKKCNVMMT